MGRLMIALALCLLLLLALVPGVGAAGPELAVVEKKCTMCHDLQVVLDKEAYFADWQRIVERMAAYDSNLITAVDKLSALKYIKENLALDGPGGRARQQGKP